MLRFILLGLFLLVLSAYGRYDDKDMKKVYLEGIGNVIGKKYWDSEFYEFMGVPYATQPKGADKYKAPLPPTPWEEDLEANRGLLICQQVFYSGHEDEGDALYGQDDCLVASYFVPKKASETNLVPVIIFIHGGAYAGGNGNMAKYLYIARQDVLVINVNYRLGALGFACLGTEEIPGNAALKDIVAALKFIKKHVKTFGGDPDNITLAGFSVGATLAEIVALSKESRGLFNKLALDSGSALSPYAVNRNPIETAKNIAISIGYEDDGDIEELNDFLLEIDIKNLQSASRNYFLKNATFGFSPCIENPSNPGAVLIESPLDTLKRGDYGDFALLIGFANMEGISRTSQFGNWSIGMNKNLAEFFPIDLDIKDDKVKSNFIKELKKYYFNNKPVDLDNIQGYINYFSDSMFKYAFLTSLKLHSEHLTKSIYAYEFTYVGKLNTKHEYMDRIRGASHRDATAYVLDFYDWTRNYTDMDRRDLMNFMWGDFLRYENPTAFESSLLKVTWEKYTKENLKYMDLGDTLVMKKDPFSKGYKLWENVYSKYYRAPTVVDPEPHKFKLKLPKKKREKKIEETKPVVNEAIKSEDDNPTPDNVDKKPATETPPIPSKAKDSTVEDKTTSATKNSSSPPKPSTESKSKLEEQKTTETKPSPKNTNSQPTKPLVKDPVVADTDKTPSADKASGASSPKSNSDSKASDPKVKSEEQKPAQTKSSSKKADTPKSKEAQSAKEVKE